jgi:hypothetical protein
VPGCVRGDAAIYYYVQDSEDGLTTQFTSINRYDMKGFFGNSSLHLYNLTKRVKLEIKIMTNALYKVNNNNLSTIQSDPSTTKNSSDQTPITDAGEDLDYEQMNATEFSLY